MLYEDPVVALDDDGITIKSYGRPGSERHISYSDIRDISRIRLGIGTGRWRLVGISPGRPFHFFHWDPNRASKSHGLSLSLGRRRRRTAITPEDPGRVLALVSERIG